MSDYNGYRLTNKERADRIRLRLAGNADKYVVINGKRWSHIELEQIIIPELEEGRTECSTCAEIHHLLMRGGHR